MQPVRQLYLSPAGCGSRVGGLSLFSGLYISHWFFGFFLLSGKGIGDNGMFKEEFL